MNPPPLHGLRVLDLSTVLAGPNAARYLADFGADVIKVERPDTGDSLRNMAWRDPRDGTGLWWKLVNRNKRTLALDLKAADDRELFLRLVDDAHVVIENFRPGTMERLGLGPDASQIIGSHGIDDFVHFSRNRWIDSALPGQGHHLTGRQLRQRPVDLVGPDFTLAIDLGWGQDMGRD